MKYSIKSIVIIFLGILTFSFIKSDSPEILLEDLEYAQKTIGINFTFQEQELMLDGLNDKLKSYKSIREYPLTNDIPPSLIFNPVPPEFYINKNKRPIHWEIPDNIELPEDKNKLAFYSILELASLLKYQKITSTRISRIFHKETKRIWGYFAMCDHHN